MESNTKEVNLKDKALDHLEKFLELDNGDLEDINPKILQFLQSKARIGMQIFREVNIGQRSMENNIIRIYKEISLDKKQFAQFIKKSLPKYYPISD